MSLKKFQKPPDFLTMSYLAKNFTGLRLIARRYVFNRNIENMHREILIHSDQPQYQWILYCKVPVAVLDCELNTVAFGVNCAP